MRGIAKTSTPIHLIVHYPKTEAEKRELAKRVAGVHASLVYQYIQKLSCPSEQKVQLLDAVVEAAAEMRAGEQTR
ncbi:MAG: hypothetical protein ACI4D7_14825 [Lachnospiraceae bacterium]